MNDTGTDTVKNTPKNLSIATAVAFCEELGLDPKFVREIKFTPMSGTVVVYKKDEDGEKFIEFSPAGHAPATETFSFDVVPADVAAAA